MKWYLRRWYINSQGYDRKGRYWGIGKPMYRATNDNGFVPSESVEYLYIRAEDREDAKRQILENNPEYTFYR